MRFRRYCNSKQRRTISSVQASAVRTSLLSERWQHLLQRQSTYALTVPPFQMVRAKLLSCLLHRPVDPHD